MTDRPTDRDRLRDAFAVPPEEFAASADCPSDETIWRAAQGELETLELETVLDHTTSCAACAESWRMARGIGRESDVRSKGTLVTFPGRRRVLMLGAVAATILLALLVAPTLDERSVPPVEFRDPSGVRIESLLDETRPVTRDAAELRWAGAPDGTLYTIEVADENLVSLVRSAPQEATVFTVPADVLEPLAAGSTVYWRIEAVLPDGTRVSSGVFLLRLR